MRTVFAFILLLVTAASHAQVAGHNIVFWPKSTTYTVSYDMIPLANDGVVELRGVYNADGFVLCRIDSAGNPLWHKEIICNDTFGMLFPAQLVSLPGNNFLLTGLAENWNYPAQNGAFIMCYDSSGNLLWKKIYRVDGYANYRPVTMFSPAGQGNIFIAMHSMQPNTPWTNGTVLFKTDINGNILDSAFIETQGYSNRVSAGIINTAGNLVLTAGGNTYLSFMTLDTALQLVNARIISGFPNGAEVNAMAEAAPGTYLLSVQESLWISYWLRVDNTGHVTYSTMILANVSSIYTLARLQRTSNGDMYGILCTDWPSDYYAGSQLIHFNDTCGVVSSHYLYGGAAKAVAICDDRPVVAVQCYANPNNYPTAYPHTDSADGFICNISSANIADYAAPAFTESVPNVIYNPMLPHSVYVFSDSTITTTAFTVDDYCLYNSVSEPAIPTTKIWPVPAHDVLYVENPRANSVYIIYDINGNVVLSTSNTDGTICIESLAPGYYMLEVNAGSNQLSRAPFIKQ